MLRYFANCIKVDLFKNGSHVFQPSDYFVMNLANLRYDVLYSRENLEECFTYINNLERANKYIEKLKQTRNIGSEFDVVKMSEISDADLHNGLDKFLAKVLVAFSESNIILFETKLMDSYVNKEKTFWYKLRNIPNPQNLAIDRGYRYVKERLPGCHVIPFPQGMHGFEGHKWGKGELHYQDQYYEYAYKAMKVIINKLDKKEEIKQIEDLKTECEESLVRERNSMPYKYYHHGAILSMIELIQTARIDIKNEGKQCDLKIQLDTERCIVDSPAWFSKNGVGYTIESWENHLKLDVTCIGDGNLKIYLRGIDRKKRNGERRPFWIDWISFRVNKIDILTDVVSTCHDKPYVFTYNVSDGEFLSIELVWDSALKDDCDL